MRTSRWICRATGAAARMKFWRRGKSTVPPATVSARLKIKFGQSFSLSSSSLKSPEKSEDDDEDEPVGASQGNKRQGNGKYSPDTHSPDSAVLANLRVLYVDRATSPRLFRPDFNDLDSAKAQPRLRK